MSIYEKLSKFRLTPEEGKKLFDEDNFPLNYFYHNSEDDISKAEQKIGFKFPDELRELFLKLGSGRMQFPAFRSKDWENEFDKWITFWNDFLYPISIAKLYIEKHKNSVYFRRREFDWCEFKKNKELPIMQFDEADFIVYRIEGGGLWLFDVKVADTIEEFMEKLAENPHFYVENE